ncbi:unnamed protein product [Phytomonas sp. EM1]|nr:unnamed protein product [Phytomonas sp. EM1]|eukprot:CCW60058.1 unnamed protein product [Phytomonas sp. isolate EM1]
MSRKILLLFDVDGTLTPSRLKAPPEIKEVISKARKAGYGVGIVGGSDFSKQKEQLGDNILNEFDYVFSENGLVSYKNGEEFHRTSILEKLGNDRVLAFVKKCLHYIADLDIPVQRGTFFEFRNGMFNVSPIGRNCSQKERDDFDQYDKEHQIRATMIKELKKTFPDYPLDYSIGGQISFDVYPKGWDKTYCLQFIEKEFDEIHFFGDKTSEGGNDYEIYTDSRTIGHAVKSYKDTLALLEDMIKNKK